MIKSLQSLRGLFAVGIFTNHCFNFLDSDFMLWCGDCGVAFFFILSGFVLSLGYSSRVLSPAFNYRVYAVRRLIRFMPLHLCILCICTLAAVHTLTAIDYLHCIPVLLLLQSWSPNPDVFLCGNAPSWALSDLLFFAAVFPLVIHLRSRYPKLFYIFIGVVLIAYPLYISLVPEERMLYCVYILPAARLIDFLLGMLLADGYTVLKDCCLSSVKVNILQIVAFAVLALAVAAYGHVSPVLDLASLWWVPVMLIIVVFALTDGRGILGRLLKLRPLVVLGDFSFTFYLIHFPLCRFLLHIFAPENPSQSWIVLFYLCSLAVTLALSWVVWRYLECPASDALLRRFAPKNPRPFVNDTPEST